MKLIALAGGIASGKTAVAKELQRRGYKLVSYTDYLKELLAYALTSVGVPTTDAMILADKERYRPLIQEFGTIIGFDSGVPFMGDLLEREWDREQPAVIDNLRTDEQAKWAQGFGFTVVELRASEETRRARLVADGKDPDAVLARDAHHIEAGLSPDVADYLITVDTATPDLIANCLEDFPDFHLLVADEAAIKTVEEAEGQEETHYATVEDLVADLEAMRNARHAEEALGVHGDE